MENFYKKVGELVARNNKDKVYQDIRLKRVELVLGLRIPKQSIFEKLEVFVARNLLFGPQKYIGPGTNLKQYIRTGQLPSSTLDYQALFHDLAYLYAGSFSDVKKRQSYIRKADLDLINVADSVIADPKSSEADKLNAGLTKRLLGDLKPAVEHFIHFEGTTHPLTLEEGKYEFQQLIRDLDRVDPQLASQARSLGYHPLPHDLSYSSFQEKLEIIENRMRRTQSGIPEVIKETPVIDNGAQAIMEQNRAISASQDRIDIRPQVITGERILKLFTVRDSGYSVIPTGEEKMRNRIWLAKFDRVAEGAGDLGNNLETMAFQITKPIDNVIIDAWHHSQVLRYSGRCFDGGVYVKPEPRPTFDVLERHKAAMINTIQASQDFIPTTAVGFTKPGRKINMLYDDSNNRFVTPAQYRRQNPLIFPQRVDGVPT